MNKTDTSVTFYTLFAFFILFTLVLKAPFRLCENFNEPFASRNADLQQQNWRECSIFAP